MHYSSNCLSRSKMWRSIVHMHMNRVNKRSTNVVASFPLLPLLMHIRFVCVIIKLAVPRDFVCEGNVWSAIAGKSCLKVCSYDIPPPSVEYFDRKNDKMNNYHGTFNANWHWLKGSKAWIVDAWHRINILK